MCLSTLLLCALAPFLCALPGLAQEAEKSQPASGQEGVAGDLGTAVQHAPRVGEIPLGNGFVKPKAPFPGMCYDPLRDPATSAEAAHAYYTERARLAVVFVGQERIDRVFHDVLEGNHVSNTLVGISIFELAALAPKAEEYLQDGDPEVRDAAISALCDLGDKRGFDQMLACLTVLGDYRSRSKHLQKWADYRPAGYEEALLKAMNDPAQTKALRRDFAELLVWQGDGRGLDFLMPLLEEETDLQPNELYNLKHLRDPRVTALLQRLRTEDAPPALRRVAGQVLARQGDAEAQREIAEELRQATAAPAPCLSWAFPSQTPAAAAAGTLAKARSAQEWQEPRKGYRAPPYSSRWEEIECLPRELAVQVLCECAQRRLSLSEDDLKRMVHIGGPEIRDALLWRARTLGTDGLGEEESMIQGPLAHALLHFSGDAALALGTALMPAREIMEDAPIAMRRLVAETLGDQLYLKRWPEAGRGR